MNPNPYTGHPSPGIRNNTCFIDKTTAPGQDWIGEYTEGIVETRASVGKGIPRTEVANPSRLAWRMKSRDCSCGPLGAAALWKDGSVDDGNCTRGTRLRGRDASS